LPACVSVCVSVCVCAGGPAASATACSTPLAISSLMAAMLCWNWVVMDPCKAGQGRARQGKARHRDR
jgi:hypothetical protein